MSGKLYKHNPVIRGHMTDSSDLSIPEEEQKAVVMGEFDIDLFNAIYYHAQQSLWNTNPDSVDFETVTMRYSDMKKFMGIRSNDFKTMTLSALSRLLTTDIVFGSYTYDSGRTVRNLHVSAISGFAEEVNFDSDIFSVDLNPIMSRAMAQHQNNFTLIDLKKSRRLQSKYAKRLYEWMLSMKQVKKEIWVDLDAINKLFGVDDYKWKNHLRTMNRIYPQLSEVIAFDYRYDRTRKEMVITFP